MGHGRRLALFYDSYGGLVACCSTSEERTSKGYEDMGAQEPSCYPCTPRRHLPAVSEAPSSSHSMHAYSSKATLASTS